MKKEGVVLVLISIILFASLVAASFNVEEFFLQDEAVINTTVSASVDISFNEQLGTSLFTDSFENEVELLEVLKNSNYIYNCSTGEECAVVYSEVSPASQKTFSLGKGEEKVFGLVLGEKIKNITGFKFTLASTAGIADESQFSIDLLEDDSIDMQNLKIGVARSGSTNYGCYNLSRASTEISLSETPYCQLVNISETPGIEGTAFIKEEVAGTNDVAISLYTKEGEFLDSCNPNKAYFQTSGSDISCSINYPVLEKDEYYLCLSAETTGPGEYKTKGYSSQDPCGFLGVPLQEPTSAYRIGATLKKYASPGEVKYEDVLSNGVNLPKLIENYLDEEYNLDCTDELCYIPIKITSNVEQDFTLKNLELSYEAVGLSGATLSEFYEFNKVYPLITSEEQSLSLNGLFLVPGDEGDYDYSLKLDGDEILEGEITVKDIEFNLYPETAALNYPTEFKVTVEDKNNVALVIWNFGDETSQLTSTTLTKPHTYEKKGNFTIKVTVKNFDDEEYSKNFEINVVSAKEAIKDDLDNKRENLNSLKSKRNLLSGLKRTQLESWINFQEFEERLTYLEQKESIASSDSDYNELIDAIFEKPFPKLYSESITGKRYFAPETSKIDLDILGEITGDFYGGTIEEKEYALYWVLQNLKPLISSEKISLEWEDKSVDEANLFTITFTGPSEEAYFVIEDVDGLTFTNSADVMTGSGYSYIPIISTDSQISFVTTDDLSISTLPAFFAPSYVEAPDVDTSDIEGETNNTWIIVLIVILLLFITLIVYIILHKWYKVKYERHLFEDRNQLYNLSLYINSSIKDGMENSEIKKNLKKAGWSGEQITYAMKKYAGKRTGMPDIFSIFKRKKNVTVVPKNKNI